MPDIGAIAATEEIGWTSSTQLLPNGDGGLLIKTNAGSTLLSSDTSGNITPTGAVRVGASDCVLARDAANVLALRNSTNAQAFRVYNTYTDASNYERLDEVWSGNICYIRTIKAGSGTNRQLSLQSAASNLNLQTSGNASQGWRISTGDLEPIADATYDIGSSSNRAVDVHLSGIIYHGVTAGITASATQTQGQQPLTTEINEVSTVGTTNDVVTLPTAAAGAKCTVINNGANTMQIFPASGDNLGAGVDTAATLAAGSNVTYVAYDATNWESI